MSATINANCYSVNKFISFTVSCINFTVNMYKQQSNYHQSLPLIAQVLRFRANFDDFVVTQSFTNIQDAAEISENRDSLIVVVKKTSTIVYKRHKHRFVPLQMLEPVDQVYLFYRDKKIFLCLISEQMEIFSIFQYNGWKFVELLVTLNIDNREIFFANPPTQIDSSLVFSNAVIDQLQAGNIIFNDMINDITVIKIYKDLRLLFSTLEIAMEDKTLMDATIMTTLQARNVRVTSKVVAQTTQTSAQHDLISDQLLNYNDDDQDLDFAMIKVTRDVDFPCPIPAVDYQHIMINGLVNGRSFRNLDKELLKAKGPVEQVLAGVHSFHSLRSTHGNFSLDLATNCSHQKVQIERAAIGSLNITTGGFLLPLNGDVARFPRTLTASHVKLEHLVDLQGKINGSRAEQLGPLRHFQQKIVLDHQFSFANLKVMELLEAQDLVGNHQSIKTLRSTVIPLNSTVVPVHTSFMAYRVNWTDVSTLEQIGSWITKKNDGFWNIMGTKMVPANIVSPKIDVKLAANIVKGSICVAGVITDDIFTSVVTADRASINHLEVDATFSAKHIGKDLDDGKNANNRSSAKPLYETRSIVSDSAKNYTANEGSGRWVHSRVFENPITVGKLHLKTVRTLRGIQTHLPKVISSFEAKRIIIKRINGDDFQDSIKTVVRNGNMTFLPNIIFAGGLEAQHVIANNPSIRIINSPITYLGAKTINGSLTMRNLNIPNILNFPTDEMADLIVLGNVSFLTEPRINKIHQWELKNLVDDVWMANKPTKLSPMRFSFEKINFKSTVDVRDTLDTLNSGPWNKIALRTISATKDQKINQNLTIDSLYAPNLFMLRSSKLTGATSTNLHDLEHNTLKTHGKNLVRNEWQLQKALVAEHVVIMGKINDLNLNKDVLRRNNADNIITAPKIVGNLVAKNIQGLEFQQFAQNTVKTGRKDQKLVVQVDKTFANVQINNLQVLGFVKMKNITNCWRNHTDNIFGKTHIKTLLIRDLVNITNLTENQLRRQLQMSTMQSPMDYQDSFDFLGVINTINFQHNWTHADPNYNLMMLIKKISASTDFAKAIDNDTENYLPP